MPEIKATLTDELMKALLDLAEKRGVDANTVLQQAIATEKLLSDNVGPRDDLLIKRGNVSGSLSQIIFDHGKITP